MNPTLIALLLLVLQASAAGRLPLQGRVVRGDTNEPVAKASVVVARVGGTLDDYRTALTDESGRFTFTDLTPGNYRVYATRTGYLQTELGRPTTFPRQIAVSDRRPQADTTVSMIPAGVITGRVRDKEGVPMRNVWVRALRAGYRSGERQLEMVEFGETNDLGEYRIFDLPPGEYFVNASVSRPRIEGDRYVAPAIPLQISTGDRGYRFEITTPGDAALLAGSVSAAAFEHGQYFLTYFPNTRNEAEASSLELRAGATLSGIDLMLSPTPTVHVRGRVIDGVTGQPARAYVGLAPLGGVRTGDTGTFDIPGAPAGRYELWSSVDAVNRLAYALIDVGDQDLRDITLTARAAAPVTGRVTVDGKMPPNNARFTVSLISPPGRSRPGGTAVQPDGTFVIANVGPGDYRLRVSGQNAYLKTARFGAADVFDAPIHIEQDLRGQQLEIDMSLKTGAVEIVVLMENRQPARGMPVALLPDPPGRNRSELYKVGTSDEMGRVRIEGIAPGDYKVFASEDIDPWTWRDPALLRKYEGRSQAIRVVENGKHTMEVRAISARP